MKKAFTLIELLACIVIVSIIVLITVPKINDTLKERKNNSFYASAKSIIRDIEYLNIEKDTTEVWLLSDLIDISSSSYDLDNSYVKIENNTITLNLVGNNEFDNMYLCGITNTSDTSDVSISDTECTPFLEETYSSITMNLNGGVLLKEMRNEYLVGLTIKLDEPIKNNYIFTGYQVDSGNSVITNNKLVIGSDTQISANYVRGYQLEVNLDGGSTKKDYSGLYELGDEILLEEPSKDGYRFLGWEIVTGNSVIDNNTITIGNMPTIIIARYRGSR